MIPFISQMVKMRDRAAALATRFGIPNVRSLIIRTRTSNGNIVYKEIIPTPIITEISNSSERMNGISGISGSSQIFEVKGVSRKYSLVELEYEALDYVVDGKVDQDQLTVVGITCQLVSVTEKSTTWDLRLVQKLGEQSLYLNT